MILIPDKGALEDTNFCVALLACMIMWNDENPVVFTELDFAKVAGRTVLEGRTPEGEFIIGLMKEASNEPEEQQNPH